jgi:hypothetical protein
MAQAGHACQQGNAASPTLLCQESREQAAMTFIGAGHQSVDGTMFLCRSAVRMLFTDRTFTRVDELPSLAFRSHNRLSPGLPL